MVTTNWTTRRFNSKRPELTREVFINSYHEVLVTSFQFVLVAFEEDQVTDRNGSSGRGATPTNFGLGTGLVIQLAGEILAEDKMTVNNW